ncbi:cupin domain-containing protein [Sphingomonas sp. BIUV-7]|uniref:Cupin domain-containing protein n=1 Tax=Sphingomonas natans TaxID=3063330 RepID=A0ABT8Y874_9SPHN|nr:cupin domain-containing protein [Sphingomonas sp. BIUV-7]MDO6414532.1 cupin domain-containing protein [Sphingomonas sp. BIUV-7]
MAEEAEKKSFTIYRAKDAPTLMESGHMAIAPISAEHRAGVMKAVEAGYTKGDVVRVLVDLPGFSLTHAWLKKHYPLALHTHDSDCLYYIVAGSLRMGTEDLGAQDSFFVPAGVPYTYRPGPDGVEVLEFRHATQFDFVNLSKTATFWEKATQIVKDNVADWEVATPPSQMAR